ncbi:MAG TPA: helix-turn-helix transcriptional regulator [Gaiellaceae bacterium]|nr:helix-turn-helix transcriptional regulator [Gaiellaceae bacterium]
MPEPVVRFVARSDGVRETSRHRLHDRRARRWQAPPRPSDACGARRSVVFAGGRRRRGIDAARAGGARAAQCGEGPKEIAAGLGITVSTVRTHIRHILRKLGVHTQLAAVVRASSVGG